MTCTITSFLVVLVTYIQKNGKNYENFSDINYLPVSNYPENKYHQVKRYIDVLCRLDDSRILELKQLNSVDDSNIFDRFQQFIQNPMDLVCKDIQKFGGHYISKCKYTDGGKFACMDNLLKDIQNQECLIYSFGINQDWTFEDMMDRFGCKIYAHDPTVDYPRKRSDNINFEKVGIAAKIDTTNNLKDLSSILSANGHSKTKISYLKMDIEGYELDGLATWLDTGALDYVDQIALEFHLNHGDALQKTRKFAKILLDLYTHADFKLIAYETNNCYKNKDENQTYFSLAEIVLKKSGTDYPCIN